MAEAKSKNKTIWVTKRSWEEFRKSGMLWFANRILHIFGWAIVFKFDDKGKLKKVYAARVKYRGFSSDCETTGFKKVSNYMLKNAKKLKEESLL